MSHSIEVTIKVRQTFIEVVKKKKVVKKEPRSIPYIVQNVIWNYVLALLHKESVDLTFPVSPEEAGLIVPFLKESLADLNEKLSKCKVREK